MDNKVSSKSGVGFHKLNVFGNFSSHESQHTVSSYLLAIPRSLQNLFRRRRVAKPHILHDFNGFIRRGEMVLVLGRPGSGCSTFLKVLAGETPGLHVDKSSKILYNGSFSRKDGLEGNAIYLAELDVHFPDLTLDAHDVAQKMAADFSLNAAYNSLVGDAMIRGISGGEKRRASIAEVFISGSPLQCWDNSTRGLDSSTALSFIRLLRSSTTSLQTMTLMSIYQASDAMYQNFDTVMLLHEGFQIYFGPREHAVAYFTSLGFEKSPRATIADFLTSITHPVEHRVRDGFEDRTPRSAKELADAWSQSPMAKTVVQRLIDEKGSGDFSQERHNVIQMHSHNNAYKVSTRTQVCLCLRRASQRLRNNFVPPIAGVCGNTIIAIVVGSVYYNLPEDTNGMYKRAVLLFFSLVINSYAPAFDVFAMWHQRPIVEKHHRYAFYKPFTESLASIICDLPTKLATIIMFNVPLYFMTNLRRSAGAFFTYIAFLIATTLTMSMFFRTVGSLSRSQEQSMVPSSSLIFIFSAYAGYVIPAKDMVPWLAWLRRVDPLAYAYEGMMINEFDGRTFACAQIIPFGSGYSSTNPGDQTCAVIGAEPGRMDVNGSLYIAEKYSYRPGHLWRNFGIILAMLIIFGAIHLAAVGLIPAQRSRGEVLLYRRNRKTPKSSHKDEESGTVGESPNTAMNALNVDADISHRGFLANHSRPEDHAPVFHWSNLHYSIGSKKTTRLVLQDVEGWIRPGSLTALMGVTGAGKTSLLDVLANRTNVGEVKGNIALGASVLGSNFQRLVGYVQQDDIHLPTTTVREALVFSAKLRLPANKASNEASHVEDILKLLEMTPYADAVVGVPGEGLNVEQRKRLSIAVELVTQPELLLFLDEPTSGLDSQTAWSICMLLRKLASSGQAILTTIHQPSSQVFELFDRLLLLDGCGRIAYFGDTGKSSSTVIEYFERNASTTCDVSQNPAEWILNLSQDQSIHSKWEQSNERKKVLDELAKLRELSPGRKITGPLHDQQDYAAPMATQLWMVSLRTFQEYWRDPVYIYCKIALCGVTTLLNGLSFLNAKLDIQGITNVFFSIFLFTQLFSTIDQQIIPRLISSRSLFEARERRSRTYSWTVFVTAHVIVELFWQTIASVLVFIAWYYPTGLWRNHDAGFPSGERAGLAFGVIWLFCLWISTFSQAVGIGITHAETAVQVATLFFWLSLVFCGVLVAPKDLPRFWHFVYRASPLTYFIDGTVVASLSGTTIRCSDVEIFHVDPPTTLTCGEYLGPWINSAGGYLENANALNNCKYCPISEANEVLHIFGISVNHRWHNFAYLFVYVCFNIVATFVVYWLVRERRSSQRKKMDGIHVR